MKAYAVLNGGGVKGAALAGCLKAAKEQNIEFVGYGGTSAGAIVALLASVGYTGDELHKLFKTNLQPLSLLDDDGIDLALLKEAGSKIDLQSFRAPPSGLLKFLRYIPWLWHMRAKLAPLMPVKHILKRMWTKQGLYHGNTISTKLEQLVREKKGAPPVGEPISFETLEQLGGVSLKILASDITGRCPAVYSRQDSMYGQSAVEAVRASACYPLLFEPRTAIGRRLSDGGLSSNLPTFLFANEHMSTHFPVLAFSLVTPESSSPSDYSFHHFIGELLDTALDAHDQLIGQLVSGLYQVKVTVPKGISTLKFDLTDAETDSLFWAGYSATSTFLNKTERFKLAKKAGQDLRKELMAHYGDRKLFETALAGLALMISDKTKAINIRCTIMLPTGRATNSRIVVYTHGFGPNDGDIDLELGEFAGFSGKAIKERSLVVADLGETSAAPEKWGLEPEEQSKIPRERAAIVSAPIFPSQNKLLAPNKLAPIGALSVDTTTPLSESGWLISESISLPLGQVMQGWADVIGNLLQ